MENTKYPRLVVGSRVIKYSYWDTEPKETGVVIAQSDHFVHVRLDRRLLKKTEWWSKYQVEEIK